MITHFTISEFEGKGGIIPAKIIPLVENFIIMVLMSIRKYARTIKPDAIVRITSGYRNKVYNKGVGGSPSSQHVYTKYYCAADIQVPGVPLQRVFDWIRLKSGLPYDQVILERGKLKRHEYDDCIHLSYVRRPRRIALDGSTHGAGGYTRVKSV